jgi:hypothetical protein
MKNLVKVVGKDITYKTLDAFIYIDASTIVAAYPYYAIKGVDGSWFTCVPSHEGAELITFKLKCSNGEICTCSNEDELSKIGLSLKSQAKKSPIGFIKDHEGHSSALELV